MANTPIPVASLPDPPRYAVESTDADFEILVVVPTTRAPSTRPTASLLIVTRR